MENTLSPATASLHAEQARQRSDEGNLDEGLRETFPASDPVSHTVTSTVGASSLSAATQQDSDTYPMVDEALAATNERHERSSTHFSSQEMQSLQNEVKGLNQSMQEIADACGRLVVSKTSSARHKISTSVSKHPYRALGFATLVGYLWGMSR